MNSCENSAPDVGTKEVKSPEILVKGCAKPLVIGIPVNGRMKEDCAPMLSELGLVGQQGRFKSEAVPGAVFRTMRVKDIARFVKEGVFDLGIVGDDTALEANLESGAWYKQVRPWGKSGASDFRDRKPWTPLDYCDGDVFDYEPNTIKALPWLVSLENKLATFNVEKPSALTFFVRNEVARKVAEPTKSWFSYPEGEGSYVSSYSTPRPEGKIVTSYPNLVTKLVRRRREDVDFVSAQIVGGINGQIESVVRNNDLGNVVGGVDVVRTGKTLEEYGLTRVLDLMESRPGLWRTPKVSEEKERQIEDVSSALLSKVRDFLKR